MNDMILIDFLNQIPKYYEILYSCIFVESFAMKMENQQKTQVAHVYL